jgi:hypothetical protein
MSRQFFGYGYYSMQYMSTNPDTRGLDPFNLIFPKMTKCTLNTYGPSGSIQNHDGLCILPINVLNEKIYLLTWFVFFGLAIFTLIHHLIASIIIVIPGLRCKFLTAFISPERQDMRRKLHRILKLTSFGDWLMLYMLAKNTDRVIFGQVVDNLKYPDYDYELEETDEHNLLLERIHQVGGEKNDNKTYSRITTMDKMKL